MKGVWFPKRLSVNDVLIKNALHCHVVKLFFFNAINTSAVSF